MPKYITEMYAFVMEDKHGVEGIIGENIGGQWFPFIGSDMSNMGKMIEMADKISMMMGHPYKILKFKLTDTIKYDPAKDIRYSRTGKC